MSTLMEPVTAKLLPSEKDEFIRIAERIGTTPSNAIRMFVSAFNRRGGFPFDPSNPYGFNRDTLAAMDDAAHGRNLICPFDSTEEMWSEIFNGEEDATN